MHVLIIDDSRALRAMIRKMLTEAGCQVSEAGNGREGLERLGEITPDVVLVDWNMPVMNGFEFLVAVRSDPARKDLPLMMVTTETEMAQMARALDAGANEYVMKPFSRDSLFAKFAVLGLPVTP
jgi:two-component system chemotaxis response regulator CheY